MKENLTGLILSGLLHAGIIGWAANATYLPQQKEKAHVQNHQLTVSLFQAEKIVTKPAQKKAEPLAPPKAVKAPPPINLPKENIAKAKPEELITSAPIKKTESAKTIVVASVKTIEPKTPQKQKPVTKAETPRAIIQSQNKALPKPVRTKSVKKLKKTVKKVVKRKKLKAKKKRLKKVIKPRHKIVKKRVVKKRRIPPIKRTITKKVVARPRFRPRSKPISKPRIAPKKRKTVAKTRRRTKAAPIQRRVVRKAPIQRRPVRKTPVTRKVQKRGGGG